MILERPSVRWLVVALAVFGSTPAFARGVRADRAHRREGIQAQPFFYPRPPTTTLRAPDDGIIHWNTPNKDGNLGGPGTGGGGGGGG
ncbi:hypothetical protein ACLBXJ_20085 [Methylobacterium mesophilicum]|uniref:hypothetical protein n=2 Tax=Methylobacteriaceae TaxID=119045 RepID=UPI0011C7F3CA|nr:MULTISPECIES: hypothetical protein [Methylobacterium]TXN45127.1 hypothetical protein FV233_12390 [Methylobacterium sp. WL7]GJE22842.1 hypothetical protein JHFBIEKO_3299 [Methylobacterium mesophilicum]